ncbi:MAG: 50S ribosomal protein L28 [Proteobacteria bacterium]|nr:50S ribosomal protein L28 [Pseudomonadota bacterium]
MARKCSISGKTKQYGHRVSHANNKTKHVFDSNLQSKRIWVPALKRFVRIKLSTRVIRTIDKLGLEATLKKYNVTIDQLAS